MLRHFLGKIKRRLLRGNRVILNELARNSKELLWHDIFIDTTRGYGWLNVGGGLSLSLGRWAIGYNYAYVLSRALNDTKPRRILELGLGQSSKLIAAYAASNKDATFDIVEQDADWAALCKQSFCGSKQINIFIREIEQKRVSPKFSMTNIYKDFASVVNGKKYSLVSIDGPWGSKGRRSLSRVDILPHIPDILADDFVIICDDCERAGEKAMIKMLEDKLRESGVDFVSSGFERYRGAKDIVVIASKRLKFVTTM